MALKTNDPDFSTDHNLKRGVVRVCLLLVFCLFALGVWAQETAQKTSNEANLEAARKTIPLPQPEALDKRSKELENVIALLQAALTAVEEPGSRHQLREAEEQLSQAGEALREQGSLSRQIEEMRARDPFPQTDEGTLSAQTVPLREVDRLRNELEQVRLEVRNLEGRQPAAQPADNRAGEENSSAGPPLDLSRAKTLLVDPLNAVSLQSLLDMARQENRDQSEKVQELQHTLNREKLEEAKAKLEQAQKALDHAMEWVSYTRTERSAVEQDLRHRAQTVTMDLQELEARREAHIERLDRYMDTLAQKKKSSRSGAAREAAAAENAWIQALNDALSWGRDEAEDIQQALWVWDQRFDLLQRPDTPPGVEVQSKVEALKDDLYSRRSAMDGLLLPMAAEAQRISMEGEGRSSSQATATHLQALAFHSEQVNHHLLHLSRQLKLVEILERELDQAQNQHRLALGAGRAKEMLNSFLGKVILGDKEQGLTVGKLLLAVLLLVFGLWLARRLTSLFRRLVLNRTKLDANAQFTLERLANYALLALLVLIALSLLNIPLTLFAFMGGAIAIAAGLGGQNLLNNFMSGLILMGEKPIKISDIVEVDGRTGRVEMIGARSTRIRLFDGIQVLVPNSKLLENNVTNWTLSDKEIRLSVKVGVAYGTDADRVIDILGEAVGSIEDIIKEPEPAILFEDFGDSALVFNILFWVEIDRPMDGRRISSLLRQEIAKGFAEAGIVIAFPQRDLHLHAAAPIPLTWERKGRTEKQED